LAPPLLSVCMVVGRRDALLDGCLRSLAGQADAPPFELLAGVREPDLEERVRGWFPDATVAHVPGGHPGAARNPLIERARGEWVLFLDDDVELPAGALRHLAEAIRVHPSAGVLGGPNLTPPQSSWFQIIQGAVLASIVATGPVRRRYGAHPPGPADERFFILCNLAVRRDELVPFAGSLVCAEENALLAELAGAGVRMHYDPDMAVYHERRPTWTSFARQMFKYGTGRGQVLRTSHDLPQALYLVPTLVTAYLAATPALASIRPVLAIPAAGYLLAVLAGGVRIAVTIRPRRMAATFPATAMIVLLHVSYGAGVARGLAMADRPVEPLAVRWSEPRPA
jgi:GT2 family glycosyltransferase